MRVRARRPTTSPGRHATRASRAGTAPSRCRDLTADEIVEALADDLLEEGDVAEALRRLMERGWRSGDPSRNDLPGLQDLLERLRRRREELLEQHDLGDPLADVREELEIDRRRGTCGRRTTDGGRKPPRRPGAAAASSDRSRRVDRAVIVRGFSFGLTDADATERRPRPSPDAPRRGREPARTPGPAAARCRWPDPPAPGLRLPGSQARRAFRRPARPASQEVLDRYMDGMPTP